MSPKRIELDVDDIVRRYQAGETQGEIAAALGVRQTTIYDRLKKAGAQITRGDAMARRLARMSADERSALAAAAHDAVRGMTRTTDDLERRALGKQRTGSHATGDELAIADHLRRAGLSPVPQQAVGKYNLDIGIEPIAVELFGGAWHSHGRHIARLPQRVEDIADRGWNILIAWTHTVHPLDPRKVAEDAAAYFERTRIDPTFRRQYRVIWGDGQFLAAGSVDDDDLTLVPTGIRGAYARR